MSHKTPILLALAAGSAVLTTLAFPAHDWGFLAWGALAPFFFALRRVRPLPAGLLACVFGVPYAAGVFFWLNTIPSMKPVGFGLMLLVWSVYFLILGLLYNLLSRVMGVWAFAGAAGLWVAFEYVRSNLGFLALPWNLLGHTQYRYLLLIQIADVTGVFGVSFLIVMVNELLSRVPDLVQGLHPPGRRDRTRGWLAAATVAAALAATLLYGWHRLAAAEAPSGRLRVAVVQANVVARSNMSIPDQVRHFQTYAQLTHEVARARPDLIVWPSSSLPTSINFIPLRVLLVRLATQAGAHILVGGAGGDKFAPPRDGVLPYSNSEFLVAPDGRLVDQYNKIHLTPFTEYVPLRGIIRWPDWITTLRNSFIRGEAYTLFRVGEATFGTPICWEAVFPDVFRRFVDDGANFMVNVTNEAAFGPTAGPRQTLAMNVFRAVENRVTLARAATTGISAFIADNGRILATVRVGGHDLFVSGTLVLDVPLSTRKTFYTSHGDVFAFLVTLVAAIGAVSVIVMDLASTRRMWRSVPPEPTGMT